MTEEKKDFDWDAFRKEQQERNDKAKRARDEANRRVSDAVKRKTGKK